MKALFSFGHKHAVLQYLLQSEHLEINYRESVERGVVMVSHRGTGSNKTSMNTIESLLSVKFRLVFAALFNYF